MGVETFLGWLIALIFSLLLVTALFFSKKNRKVMLSLILSICSLGFFIFSVYNMGLTVGDEPAGYAEGKFLAIGLVLLALFCSIILLIAFGVGAHTYRASMEIRYKALTSMCVSLFFLGVINIPIALALLSYQFQIVEYSGRNLNWLAAVYTVAEWSRSIDPPLN